MPPASDVRVFIGSSSEGREWANRLQTLLMPYCRPRVWSQGVFGLSRSTLDEFVRLTASFDFAVLVLTADDLVRKRGNEQPAVRDNVLFELGLFIGALGQDRTAMVLSEDEAPKLPSDLLGITAAMYHAAPTEELEAALGPAALRIREAIAAVGRRDELLSARAHELRRSPARFESSSGRRSLPG